MDARGRSIAGRSTAHIATFALLTSLVGTLLGIAHSDRAASSRWAPKATGELHAVSAVSASDIWAVGLTHRRPGSRAVTLVEHWDGTGWTTVDSPNAPGAATELNSVSADSATDAWAVGTSDFLRRTSKTVVEHWDGARWSRVKSPNPGGSAGSYLTAVRTVSPTDVWAVGAYFRGSVRRSLVEHWDGTRWTVVDSPSLRTGSELDALSVVSSSDAWAVGSYADPRSRSLIEHWDGTQWQVVKGADPRRALSRLSAVKAVSATDVWAVGALSTSGSRLTKPWAEHWDGTGWSKSRSAIAGGRSGAALEAVASGSTNDVWAVGRVGAEGDRRTGLVEHWDGTRWNSTTNPRLPGSPVRLTGVTVLAADDAWAVGYWGEGDRRTVLEHWDGTAWSLP